MRNKKFHMDIDVLFAGSSVYMGFHLLRGEGGGGTSPKNFRFRAGFSGSPVWCFFQCFSHYFAAIKAFMAVLGGYSMV